jgi:hypothetical protein
MVVNQKFQGMIFKNETFIPIEIGDTLKGYVRLIRENGSIDLSLTPIGRKKVGGLAEIILNAIDSISVWNEQKSLQRGGWHPIQKSGYCHRAQRTA